MKSDIRIDLGFLDHPKTIKLIRKLGWEQGVQSLLRLWCFAAQYKCDGVLGNEVEDIELSAKWNGEPGKFVSTLLEIGWIEQNGVGYLLHDWEEHNPWAYHAKERSEQAREAVKKRWESRKNTKRNTKRIQSRNTPSPNPFPTPTPTPIPYPIPEDIDPEIWNDFVEMRKKIKHELSDKAALQIFKKLEDIGQDKNRVLRESIINEWRGVFALKGQETSTW